MIEKDPNILQELSTFFFKIFVPAFIAISIKVATQIKEESMNFTKVILSFVIGIGCAYFIYPFVVYKIDESYVPLLVGVVAISGEKISEYIIYKWDIDKFLNAIFDGALNFVINLIKPKK